MIKTRYENPEVLYPDEDIVFLNSADLQELKRLAVLNPSGRIRLCAHPSVGDRLHEMFIVHTQDCYVRPHKHIEKSESMAILEGAVDVVLFHDDGAVKQVISLGAANSGLIFYQRLPKNVYHMLIIKTEFLVFHEIISGPFLRENSIFPDWAPVESGEAANLFISAITNRKSGTI
jgi:cupin fold WbuC family metalloprotein